ncbi:hypothetical protein [Streptomyces justiciae]|uniref:hypothetical protein n=1 Tax=Streptomyces justiciae TaxID=2780140 RepID=UPI002117F360|nr:hypothetical protein [Streptomyces justiciae]MCW8382104.1 hypothetical protein [Streptomyces justiciae]
MRIGQRSGPPGQAEGLGRFVEARHSSPQSLVQLITYTYTASGWQAPVDQVGVRAQVVATGARRVILVHWDDFFTGLHQPLRPMLYFLDDLDATMSGLLPLARRDGVDVVLPVAWHPSAPLE